MAERTPQTFANHVKIDPPFHYFVLPVFAISWIISVVLAVRHPGFLHFWIVIFNSARLVRKGEELEHFHPETEEPPRRATGQLMPKLA